MSSISSIGSMASQQVMQHRRPDPAKMAEDLFSKLDTAGQGYLQKADFQAAFDSLSSSTSSTSSNIDSLFSQLDADSDGKVTKQEFSDTLAKLSDQLEQQFQSSRMQNAMGGGMPPPPPPQNDTGFTKDELSSQLNEIGSSDSKRSSLISSIVQNFEAADTNGDGKVSFQEAMAYDQKSSTSASSASSTSTASTGTASTQDSDAQLMLQIMRLLQAYGPGNEYKASSAFSVTA
jgi:Ca2+-binding EF-hand superfamily protein